MMAIDFGRHSFHPVIKLPAEYVVHDLSSSPEPATPPSQFTIGKYDEKRAGMYSAPLFGGIRNIHVGIDIGAPVGTEIHAFCDGQIFLFGYNSAQGDYGYTLITKHVLDSVPLFVLHGHLNAHSLGDKRVGQSIRAGEVIAWIGDRHENGGWQPHLHFQLSFEEPSVPDMPGVVSEADRAAALKKFPDPRLVLGPLY